MILLPCDVLRLAGEPLTMGKKPAESVAIPGVF